MLYIFMYFTTFPSNFQSNFTPRISVTSRVENSVDPDQLASQKPADLDLHCFQSRIYPGIVMCGLN